MRAIIEKFFFRDHVFYASQINGEVFAHLIRNGIELICFSRTGPIDSSLDALFRDFMEPDIYLGPKAFTHLNEVMPEDPSRVEDFSHTELYPIMRMSLKGQIRIQPSRHFEVAPVLDRARVLIRYYERKIDEAIEMFDRSVIELSEEPTSSGDAPREPLAEKLSETAAAEEVELLLGAAGDDKQKLFLGALVDDDVRADEDGESESCIDLDVDIVPSDETGVEDAVNEAVDGAYDLYDLRLFVAGQISGARLEAITPALKPGAMSIRVTGDVDMGEISWKTEVLYRGVPSRVAVSLLREMTEMIPAYPDGTSISMESSSNAVSR